MDCLQGYPFRHVQGDILASFCKPNLSVLCDSDSVEKEGLSIKLRANPGGDTMVWKRKVGTSLLTEPGRRECESAGRTVSRGEGGD